MIFVDELLHDLKQLVKGGHYYKEGVRFFVLRRLPLRQSSVVTVHRPFPLQNFGYGVPVAVIRFDAVLYHPLLYRLIRPSGDVSDGLDILP